MRRLTLHEEGLRSQAPTDYPCFNMDGYIRFTPGCRMRCCIVPAKTPDDQDSHLAQTTKCLTSGCGRGMGVNSSWGAHVQPPGSCGEHAEERLVSP